MSDMENIGEFEIESGSVFVTDPCYKPGTWCQARIENVRNGTWQAYKIERDGRNAELIVSCIPLADPDDIGEIAYDPGKMTAYDIGVDSGQCGFFDAGHYQCDADIVNNPEFDALLSGSEDMDRRGDRWYNACCDLTIDGGEGIVPFGVVSQSGYGDGSYDLYLLKKNDEIVAMKVVFIGEDEEESDYWGDDYADDEIKDDEVE